MGRNAITGIENHFAKVCRKPKDPSSYPKPRPRVNNVENEDQTDNVNQISEDFNPDLNQIILRMRITALHQYLQQTLQLL